MDSSIKAKYSETDVFTAIARMTIDQQRSLYRIGRATQIDILEDSRAEIDEDAVWAVNEFYPNVTCPRARVAARSTLFAYHVAWGAISAIIHYRGRTHMVSPETEAWTSFGGETVTDCRVADAWIEEHVIGIAA